MREVNQPNNNDTENSPTEPVFGNKQHYTDLYEAEEVIMIGQQDTDHSDDQPADSISNKSVTHPGLRIIFGFITTVSGYGRGMVNMVRFFMLWQLYQIAQGKKIETFEIPANFIKVSLAIAPFLAVDWIVNGYNHSMELFEEDSHEPPKSYCQKITEVLKENIAVIPIALIGAMGHSFVVHRAVAELGNSFAEHSSGKMAFKVLSWIIPSFCAMQYVLSEGQHIGHALKRPLRFDDYSEGMRFNKLNRGQQIGFISLTNAIPIITALAWGALEFTECYLILRKLLQIHHVTLGNEIAVMVATFFGLLGAFNNFIADGERFKCFWTHPFRKVTNDKKKKKKNIELPPRKIPGTSVICGCGNRDKFYLSLRLILSGTASLISSIGLGVVSFTGMMQFINVFRQFHNQEKPL